MSKKHFISVFVFMWFSISLFAQKKGPENNVKINLTALAYSNISLQYERVLGEKITAAMGIRFMIPRGLPSQITTLDTSGGTLNSVNTSGFSITPEFRWYPGTEKGAPHGFYFAPYLRYSYFSVTFEEFVLEKNGTSKKGNFKGKYSGFGGGLMIGYQWLIKDKVTIDWWIMGLHYGTSTLNMSVDHDFSTYSSSEKASAKTDIETNIQEFPLISNVSTELTNSSASVTGSMPFFGIRVGLCIGIVF